MNERPLVPAVAALLGFLFPGAGHIYCGRRTQGVIILVIGIFTGFLCGLMNVWAAVASWRLAAELKVGPPLGGRSGSALGDALDAAGDVFD